MSDFITTEKCLSFCYGLVTCIHMCVCVCVCVCVVYICICMCRGPICLCLCLNDLLDGDLCKSFFYFRILSFFLAFKHDFIKCVAFTRISASNTASDDITN